MRNLMALLSFTLLAACADQQSPTSPKSSPKGNLDATTGATTEVTKAPTASGKPADQVGFTKVERIETQIVTITANGDGSVVAYCPAGSTVVGGGHYLTGIALTSSPPLVSISEPTPGAQPGWGVMVLNHAAGAAAVNLRAYALCVS